MKHDASVGLESLSKREARPRVLRLRSPRTSSSPCMTIRFACGLCVCAFALSIPATAASARPAANQAEQAQKPAQDYAQEAVVIEQARTALRFEKDGTGR